MTLHLLRLDPYRAPFRWLPGRSYDRSGRTSDSILSICIPGRITVQFAARSDGARPSSRRGDELHILGINAYHADSSACIVRDGLLLATAEAERFRSVKHWAWFPQDAVRSCLEQSR